MRKLMLPLVFLLSSCSNIGTMLYHPYADYVFRKGGPRQITAWALEQSDTQSIHDACYALGEYLTSNLPWEADDAVEGYVAITKKVENGWPNLCGATPDSPNTPILFSSLPETEQRRLAARRLDRLYDGLSRGTRDPKNPSPYDHAAKAFLAVRPTNPEYLPLWQAHAK